MATIDFSNSSPLVLRHAVKEADATGSKLVAVYVVDESLLDHIFNSREGSPDVRAMENEAREKFRLLRAEAAPNSKVTFRVESGNPPEKISEVVKETSATLLVIGANDMTKKRLGSVAARCVRMTPCDVMVLRDWQGGDFTKVVVCDDFSASSARAIKIGARLAAAQDAVLQIVNVMYPPALDSWGAVMDHKEDSAIPYIEECQIKVGEMMEKSLAPHQEALKGLEWEAIILEGESSSIMIEAHVRAEKADLVIMGTESKSKLASYFFGTNAERLLQDLPVSVLAVR
ncbi:universal stress protein [Luteolibacter sp. AS25]|uniref:universal stress protein n=1 Tax=Luteolibacter sp. AS25 TaxID=3135776 RepID=UPI00398B5C2D